MDDGIAIIVTFLAIQYGCVTTQTTVYLPNMKFIGLLAVKIVIETFWFVDISFKYKLYKDHLLDWTLSMHHWIHLNVFQMLLHCWGRYQIKYKVTFCAFNNGKCAFCEFDSSRTLKAIFFIESISCNVKRCGLSHAVMLFQLSLYIR